MVKKTSAGLLMFRRKNARIEVLLVHPGGPWWQKKDAGAWSIPKGEYADEEPLAAARREFEEELGFTPPEHNLFELGDIRQKGGKRVSAWAVEGDCDPAAVVSNTFSIEWPPKSGKRQDFPEIDRAGWFEPATARHKINPAQVPFIDRLVAIVNQ